MADVKLIELIQKGVQAWNKNRRKYEVRITGLNLPLELDLTEAQLDGEDLRGYNLSRVNLKGANLRQAKLDGSNLCDSILVQADLTAASLVKADLRRTLCTGAALTIADLSGADIREAYLAEARLDGAKLIKTKLRNAQIKEANLFEADCREADLTAADLSRSILRSARLEGAFLTEALLCHAELTEAQLTSAHLQGADLRGAQLVDVNLRYCDLSGCFVYGASVWNADLEGALQQSLIVSAPDEPILTTDELEVAQFIYLLRDHKKLREILRAVTRRGVLILGRFGDGGLEVLQGLAYELRRFEYLPMIFDFDRPAAKNLTETVQTLAGLSRFVIVDLSGSSVPQELHATVLHHKIPFALILEQKRQPYAMAPDILEYPWVIKPIVRFGSSEELSIMLPNCIIEPAEQICREREARLKELYPE